MTYVVIASPRPRRNYTMCGERTILRYVQGLGCEWTIERIFERNEWKLISIFPYYYLELAFLWLIFHPSLLEKLQNKKMVLESFVVILCAIELHIISNGIEINFNYFPFIPCSEQTQELFAAFLIPFHLISRLRLFPRTF